MSRLAFPRGCRWPALVGLLGLLGLAWVQPAAAAAGGLVALAAGSALPLGCLLLALLLPLVDGDWRAVLGPGLARGLAALPGLALLLLPVLLGFGLLYPWVDEQTDGFRGLYLSGPAFVLRNLVYLGAWLALGRLARRGSPLRCAQGAIAAVLLSTLAALDWLMALDPHFLSTLFGLLVIIRQLLTGLAFAGLLGLAALTPPRARILRGLLLAGLLLWLYLHVMQLLIVWSVDLPHEIRWYQRRETAGWGLLGAGLAGLQALLAVGLASPLGSRPAALRLACGAILLGGVLEALWLALPPLAGIAPAWALALGTLLALLGGVAVLLGLAWPMPAGDPPSDPAPRRTP